MDQVPHSSSPSSAVGEVDSGVAENNAAAAASTSVPESSSRRSAVLATVLGGLIGLAAFEASIGLELVAPDRFGWLMGAAPADWTAHFIGWHMFRRASWELPLGALPSLVHPLGTSVGLTDSIPLLAIPLKPWNRVLGSEFQYIGFWLLSAFVLQGVFGALLMRTRTRRLTLQLVGATLFVLAPLLLARIGHPALTAQWMLLGVLWVYFGFEPPAAHRRALVALTVFVACAAAVHPYLAFMVYTLAGAFHLRALLQRPARWVEQAVGPMAWLALVAAVMFWQAGYFIVGSRSLQAEGLGEFSTNGLSLVMPMGRSRLLGDGPFALATRGQYEGFAYLGVGVLFLGFVSLVTGRQRDRTEHRRWAVLPLVMVCAALALVALSPHITIGSTTILRYSDAWWGPLSQFRASGRLIWPAYYALTFAIIMTVATRLPYRQAMLLLLAAVALQGVDASASIAEARQLRHLTWRSPLATDRFWTTVLQHYRHVSLHPTNLCAPPLVAIDYPAFGLVAGRAGSTLNAGVTSRLDHEAVARYCRHQAAEWEAGLVAPDTLYIMSIRLALGFERRAAETRLACIDVDEFGVCFPRETYGLWQDDFDIVLSGLPPLPELLAFRRTLDAEYRDAMNRPSRSVPGSMSDRIRRLALFIGYRLTGCDRDEAVGKITRELTGHAELRLCDRHLSRRLAALEQPGRVEEFPARGEAIGVLELVGDLARPDDPAAATATHVDVEGEAVWMQEYIRYRLSGRSPQEAQDYVREDIRRAVGQ